MPSGFVNNVYREDPYKNFRFRVKDSTGKTILGVSKVGTLNERPKL
jgi:hypothetical protein